VADGEDALAHLRPVPGRGQGQRFDPLAGDEAGRRGNVEDGQVGGAVDGGDGDVLSGDGEAAQVAAALKPWSPRVSRCRTGFLPSRTSSISRPSR
jgi:hypothetical protein